MLKKYIGAAIAIGLATSSVWAQPRHDVTQVVATVTFAFLPVYVAEQMGYFKAEGVDLKTLKAASAQAGLAAVAGGGAQYYLSTPVAGARSAAAGAPLVNCGALMNQNPNNIVVSRAIAKQLNLPPNVNSIPLEERFKMLRGLRIAAHTAGSSPDLTLRFMARHFGMDPERDLRILPITGDAILPALEQDRIDALIYSSPLADTAVIRHGGVKLISLADGSFKPLAGMLSISMVCNRDWVEKNPDSAAATLRAIWRGMKLMKVDPAAARAAARKVFPDLSDEIFNEAFATNLAAFPDNPRISVENMERALDFHHRMGGAPITVDIQRTFTNAAVDRAEQTMRR
jgi:NitT/TauT family transport system substrate-binding protein